MKTESKAKYRLGQELYRLANNKIEAVMVLAIHCESEEWCKEYTDNEDEYFIAYLLCHPNQTERKDNGFVDERDMQGYFESVDEAIEYLKDNIG